MIVKKVVFETDDNKQFRNAIDAVQHVKDRRIAIKIQELMVQQKVDPLDLTPYDVGVWISQNAIHVVQIINESIQNDEDIIDETEFVDENAKTKEFEAVNVSVQ